MADHGVPRPASFTALPLRDPRDEILTGPMSRAQWTAIALCCGMMVVDGYDTLAITLALPGISAAWGTAKVALGVVVSSGLIGMAAGCLLLGPVADLVGRRTVVFTSLAITCAGMALSALSADISQLMIWRFCTGIGMGSMVAVAYPLAVEYADLRSRPFALALMAIAFPLGGAAGGFVASQLMPQFGWQAAFFPGICLPLIVAVLCLRCLPEPLGLLIERPRRASFARANAYLAHIGRPGLDFLPPPSKVDRVPVARVLGPEFLSITLYLCAIYCMHSGTIYFLLTWLPQVVTGLGFSSAAAATVSACVSAGGMIGAATTSLAIRRFGAIRTLIVVFLGLGAITALVGIAPADIGLLRIMGLAAGIFIWGPIIGVNVLIAAEYPVETRATGTGLVVGSSRWVAAAGPLFGGLLLGSGLRPFESWAVAALPCLIAMGLLIGLQRKRRHGGVAGQSPAGMGDLA